MFKDKERIEAVISILKEDVDVRTKDQDMQLINFIRVDHPYDRTPRYSPS